MTSKTFNDVVYVMNRHNLTALNRIGGGRKAGQLLWPHVVANDTDCNR